MGWNDHDPHFTAIENIQEEEGVDYDTAYERYMDRMRDAAMERFK